MHRRGFTLLEVVLVLSLLVAVVALVGPALVNRLAPITFDRAAIQATNALRLAREDAQASGRLVFVYAEPAPDGTTRLVTRASLRDDQAPLAALSSGPAAGRRASPSPMVAITDEERDRVLLSLPARIRLSSEQPEATGFAGVVPAPPGAPATDRGAGLFTGETPTPDPAWADGAGSDPVLVAVFLGDGSAVAGQAVWLADREGRSARLDLHAPTGRAVFAVSRAPARGNTERPGFLAEEPAGGSGVAP